MRKFKLINNINNELNLTSKDYFLSSPDGLGFSIENEFATIGNSFIELNNTQSQKNICGVLIIKNYKLFTELIDFIRHKPLKLAYSPYGDDKYYYLDGNIQTLNKTELSLSGVLECDFDFVGYSSWYDSITINKVSTKGENAKNYIYQYPFKYSNTREGKLELVNNSSSLTPAIITILGRTVNPSWSLIQNGKVLYNGKLNLVIPKENKVIINSNAGQLQIAEYTKANEFVRNLYQLVNQETTKFVFIPPGISEFRFTTENITDLAEVFIEYGVYYDAV